jgi:hypothetical protein
MNMKNRYFILFAGTNIIIQILLAVILFLVAPIHTWLRSNDHNEFTILFISLQVTIITLGLAWMQQKEAERRLEEIESRRKFEKEEREARLNFQNNYIQTINKLGYCQRLNTHEFYSRMLEEFKNCHTGINLCYFGIIPPMDHHDNKIKKYYEEIMPIMTRTDQNNVEFRRIVRLTIANWTWIKELVEKLQGNPRVFLAVLEDVQPISEDNSELQNDLPTALSLQTVDGERVYFTSLKNHMRTVDRGDILIQSDVVCQALENYYYRLWNKSYLIIQSGRLMQKNFDLIEQKVEAMKARLLNRS